MACMYVLSDRNGMYILPSSLQALRVYTQQSRYTCSNLFSHIAIIIYWCTSLCSVDCLQQNMFMWSQDLLLMCFLKESNVCCSHNQWRKSMYSQLFSFQEKLVYKYNTRVQLLAGICNHILMYDRLWSSLLSSQIEQEWWLPNCTRTVNQFALLECSQQLHL